MPASQAVCDQKVWGWLCDADDPSCSPCFVLKEDAWPQCLSGFVCQIKAKEYSPFRHSASGHMSMHILPQYSVSNNFT